MANFPDYEVFAREVESIAAGIEAFTKMDPFDNAFEETYRSLERRRATVAAALSKRVADFEKRAAELEVLLR